MESDAVTLSTTDRQAVEKLFTQLKAGQGDRRALVDEITARLCDHHLLNTVRNLIGSPHFHTALDDLIAAVAHHVDKEQADEAEEEAAAAEEAAEPTSRSTATTSDPTRDQLYEMAKQADIPGRSTMTKDKLAQALRKQPG
jgi:hypothetical protein